MDKLPNIYVVLDEIGFEDSVDKIKRDYHIDEVVDLRQPIFKIVQEFYEKLIDYSMH